MRLRLIAIIFLGLTGLLQADDADEFILRPAPGALQRVLTRYGLELKKSIPGRNVHLVKPYDDDDFESHAQGDPDVLGVERNKQVLAPEAESGSTSPNELPLEQALLTRRMTNYFGASVWEGYARQPLVPLIGLGAAQNRGTLGAGTVAVIDTGVDPEHPALAGALLPGYDFVRDTAGIPNDLNDVEATVAGYLRQSTTAFIDNSARAVPMNQYSWAALTQSTTAFIDTGKLPLAFGHGTMVASVIRLCAPQAKIMPLKAFQADGSSNTFDLLRAIYYAAENGANVINMSFNMKEPSAELSRAIQFAAARRIVLVASAGNDGNEILVYPAAFDRTMGIASTDGYDQRSGFSNYGAELVTLAAPGEGVIVAYPGNNYASAWGTSFSTPLVSGAAALILQRNPTWSPAQVEQELKRRAKPLGSELGAGRLNVRAW